MQPPGTPLADMNEQSMDNRPFTLYVRQFGSDATVAQRLIDMIQGWEKAGRPSTEQLCLRVYPKDAAYTPSEGELAVDSRWNRLIVTWQETKAE